MCGINGAIAKVRLTPEDIQVFRGLLILNEKRGSSSTGIYMNHTKETVKKAMSSTSFVKWFNWKKTRGARFLFGHTRLPTTGVVSDRNAHPFTYGDVTGIHNGMVWNDIQFKKECPYEVDSEVIWYLLNKEQDIQKALKQIRGNFALAWTDKTEQVYLLREGNPIYRTQYKNTVYFSSQKDHLEHALMTVYGSYGEIEMLESNVLYVYKDGLVLDDSRKIEFGKIEYNGSVKIHDFDPDEEYEYLYEQGYGHYHKPKSRKTWNDLFHKEEEKESQDEINLDEVKTPCNLTDIKNLPTRVTIYDWFQAEMDNAGCNSCHNRSIIGYWSIVDYLVYCPACYDDFISGSTFKDDMVYIPLQAHLEQGNKLLESGDKKTT